MTEDDLWSKPFDQHTIAKHKILGAYISAWAPILLHSFEKKIVYIDGFAGRGEDVNGKPGSPLIAINAIANNRALSDISNKKVLMLFIEINPTTKAYLDDVLKKKVSDLKKLIDYEVHEGDFVSTLKELLGTLKSSGYKLAPTFCFVDPYGWEVLDLDLFAEFMAEKKAELFITFMVGFIDRFSTDEKSKKALSKLFKAEQLEAMNKAKTNDEKEELTVAFFVENLKSKIKDKNIFNISFAVKGKSNNTIYHLVYLTAHPAGMRVMKDAMYNVKKDYNYSFSDHEDDFKQKSIIDYTKEKVWIPEAANDIHTKLLGQTQEIGWVENYITTVTKWRYRTQILTFLEKARELKYLGQRTRKGYTYNDKKAKVEFCNATKNQATIPQ